VIAKLLHWAALPVRDRRWAAPLSAVALGFGLFVGVAIGPGAAGTFGTGVAQVIEIPGFGGEETAGDDGESETPSPSAASGVGGGEEGSSSESTPSFASSGSGFAEPAPLEPPPAPLAEEAGPALALADAVAVSESDAPTASECADLATILWQIYAAEPSLLPFADTAALQGWLCSATPAQAPAHSSR
jgi:hypothetical protein